MKEATDVLFLAVSIISHPHAMDNLLRQHIASTDDMSFPQNGDTLVVKELLYHLLDLRIL